MEIAYTILPETFSYIVFSLIISFLLTTNNIILMSRFTYNFRAKTFDILSNSYVVDDYNKIKVSSVRSDVGMGEVIRVCESIGLDKLVQRYPDKCDTVIYEDYRNFSSDEKK